MAEAAVAAVVDGGGIAARELTVGAGRRRAAGTTLTLPAGKLAAAADFGVFVLCLPGLHEG